MRDILREIDRVLESKYAQYGDTPSKVEIMLGILFEDGIQRDQLWMVETLTRMLEKICRLVNDQDNVDTSTDLLGYAVLLAEAHREVIDARRTVDEFVEKLNSEPSNSQ